jgi:hypothetical protein
MFMRYLGRAIGHPNQLEGSRGQAMAEDSNIDGLGEEGDIGKSNRHNLERSDLDRFEDNEKATEGTTGDMSGYNSDSDTDDSGEDEGMDSSAESDWDLGPEDGEFSYDSDGYASL